MDPSRNSEAPSWTIYHFPQLTIILEAVTEVTLAGLHVGSDRLGITVDDAGRWVHRHIPMQPSLSSPNPKP